MNYRRGPIYRPAGVVHSPFTPLTALFPRHFCIVVDKVSEKRESRTSSPSPQGDRKGPHPTPHHPRPYNEDEKVVTRERLIVRAGVVWSGVGTLAVALGGCNVPGREHSPQ